MFGTISIWLSRALLELISILLPRISHPPRPFAREWNTYSGLHPSTSRCSNRTARLGITGPIRRQPHHIARIKIRQLQPIFGDVAGREEIVLLIFLLQRLEQILHSDGRLALKLDGAFDREFLGALDDGRDDC